MSERAPFLLELRDDIARHPAVNHLFLNRLATSPFSREDYRVFGENHFALVLFSVGFMPSDPPSTAECACRTAR